MDDTISNTESVTTTTATTLPKECLPNLHPQRQRFDFDELAIDTLFDSGNLANAVKYKKQHYHLSTAPDCYLTSCQASSRAWFYFRVTNVQKKGNYTFTIKNIMASQASLYEAGLVPVFRTVPSSPEWNKINPQTILLVKYETNSPLFHKNTLDKNVEVTFNHTLSLEDTEVYFAYTYPWSYTDDQEFLNKCEAEVKEDQDIYFHRELLSYSRENRKIELITISSHSGKTEHKEQVLPNLFPLNEQIPRPFKFEEKKYVLISARVHPGETPASYVFKGLVKFLLDKNDLKSKAFRDNFVVLLIPMLNPDGVSRGHYRMDTQGLNLNRYYIKPTIEQHPSVYGTKQIVMDLHNQGKLFLYCDLHAHASIKGIFMFGNPMDFRDQIEGRLFPKLLSLNSKHFEYDTCDFSEANAVSGQGDQKEREGAGRIALYKETKLPKCYTLECNYAAGKFRNKVVEHSEISQEEKPDSEVTETDASNICEINDEKLDCRDPYSKESFEEVGEAIGPSLLDMVGKNPQSRLKGLPYKTVSDVKLSIGLALMKELKFRFDPYLRKINNSLQQNIEVLKTYIEQGVQIEPVRKPKKDTVPKTKKKTGAKKSKEAETINKDDFVAEVAEKSKSLNELSSQIESQNAINETTVETSGANKTN